MGSCGSEACDDTVGLQRGQDDVDEPQAEEQAGSQHLGPPRPPQLPPDLRPAPVHQHRDAHEGEDGEKRDGEGQRSGLDAELLTVDLVEHGRDGPGNADSQKHVHRVTARHVPNRRVSVLVLNRSNLTRKRI